MATAFLIFFNVPIPVPMPIQKTFLTAHPIKRNNIAIDIKAAEPASIGWTLIIL